MLHFVQVILLTNDDDDDDDGKFHSPAYIVFLNTCLLVQFGRTAVRTRLTETLFISISNIFINAVRVTH